MSPPNEPVARGGRSPPASREPRSRLDVRTETVEPTLPWATKAGSDALGRASARRAPREDDRWLAGIALGPTARNVLWNTAGSLRWRTRQPL